MSQYDPNLHTRRLVNNQPPQGWDQDYRAPQVPPQQPPYYGPHQPPYGHPYGQPYGQPWRQQPVAPPAPRKRRRVFLWVFLAIQVLFLVWIVTGVAGTSNSGAQSHTQALQQCSGNGWQGLFKSYNDCVTHYGNALNGASDIGKGLGVALIVVIWCVVDFLLGITWLVIRLSRGTPSHA